MRRIDSRLRAQAASLRAAATQAERTLWAVLRQKQLGGLKFRRQYVIGRYIADFCCPRLKLVVEVDGRAHEGRAELDASRDAYLRACGFMVLRVTNEEVLRDVDAVGLMILREAGVDGG